MLSRWAFELVSFLCKYGIYIMETRFVEQLNNKNVLLQYHLQRVMLKLCFDAFIQIKF